MFLYGDLLFLFFGAILFICFDYLSGELYGSYLLFVWGITQVQEGEWDRYNGYYCLFLDIYFYYMVV